MLRFANLCHELVRLQHFYSAASSGICSFHLPEGTHLPEVKASEAEIKRVEFLRSCSKPEEFDRVKVLAEIAAVGRSNVGKSSLINYLCQQSVAYVSSNPGKRLLLCTSHCMHDDCDASTNVML